MVHNRLVEENDKEPIALDGGDIKAIEEFLYLESLITSLERMGVDVDRWIALASRAFSALHKAVL